MLELFGCTGLGAKKPKGHQLLRLDSKVIEENLSNHTQDHEKYVQGVHVSYVLSAFGSIPHHWTSREVVQQVMIPETSRWRCRFLDTIDSEYVAPATHAVCHSMQAPFHQLVHALRQRFCTQQGDLLPEAEDVFLWIDVLAVNHHATGYKTEYRQISHVLETCRCCLLVLDGRARVLSRLPVLYQVWHVAHRQQQDKLEKSKGLTPKHTNPAPHLELASACVDPRYLRSQWLFLDVRRASIPRDWDPDWLQDALLSRGGKRVNKMIRSAIADAAKSRADSLLHLLRTCHMTQTEQHPATLVHDLHVCACITQLHGRYNDAEKLYDKAKSAWQESGLNSRPSLLLAMHHTELLLLLKKWDQSKHAAEYFLSICDHHRQHHGSHHESVMSYEGSLNSFATNMSQLEDGRRQLVHHHDNHQHHHRMFGGSHSSSVIMGTYFSAQAYGVDRGLNSSLAHVPEPSGHVTTSTLWLAGKVLLARALMGLGQSKEAEACVRKAVEAQSLFHSGLIPRAFQHMVMKTAALAPGAATTHDKLRRIKRVRVEDKARLLVALADVVRLRQQEAPAAVLKMYLTAQHRLSKLLGEQHPDVAYVKLRISQLLRSQGKVEASQEVCQEVLACYCTSWGPDHPETATARVALADVELDSMAKTLGAQDYQFTDAELQAALQNATQKYIQAFEVRRSCLGMTHPDTLAVLAGAVVHLINSSPGRLQLAQAEPLSVLALKSSLAMMGNQVKCANGHQAELGDHQQQQQHNHLIRKLAVNLVSCMHLTAVLAATAGKPKEACQLLDQARCQCDIELGAGHQLSAQAALTAGNLAQVTYDWDTSLDLYRQAAAVYNDILLALDPPIQKQAHSTLSRASRLFTSLAKGMTSSKGRRKHSSLARFSTPVADPMALADGAGHRDFHAQLNDSRRHRESSHHGKLEGNEDSSANQLRRFEFAFDTLATAHSDRLSDTTSNPNAAYTDFSLPTPPTSLTNTHRIVDNPLVIEGDERTSGGRDTGASSRKSNEFTSLYEPRRSLVKSASDNSRDRLSDCGAGYTANQPIMYTSSESGVAFTGPVWDANHLNSSQSAIPGYADAMAADANGATTRQHRRWASHGEIPRTSPNQIDHAAPATVSWRASDHIVLAPHHVTSRGSKMMASRLPLIRESIGPLDASDLQDGSVTSRNSVPAAQDVAHHEAGNSAAAMEAFPRHHAAADGTAQHRIAIDVPSGSDPVVQGVIISPTGSHASSACRTAQHDEHGTLHDHMDRCTNITLAMPSGSSMTRNPSAGSMNLSLSPPYTPSETVAAGAVAEEPGLEQAALQDHPYLASQSIATPTPAFTWSHPFGHSLSSRLKRTLTRFISAITRRNSEGLQDVPAATDRLNWSHHSGFSQHGAAAAGASGWSAVTTDRSLRWMPCLLPEVGLRILQVPKLAEVAVSPHQMILARRSHLPGQPRSMIQLEAAAVASNMALLLRWQRLAQESHAQATLALTMSGGRSRQETARLQGQKGHADRHRIGTVGSSRSHQHSQYAQYLSASGSMMAVGPHVLTDVEAGGSSIHMMSGTTDPGHDMRHDLRNGDARRSQIRPGWSAPGHGVQHGMYGKFIASGQLAEQISAYDGPWICNAQPSLVNVIEQASPERYPMLSKTISMVPNQDPQILHVRALILSNLAGLLAGSARYVDAESAYLEGLYVCQSVRRYDDALVIALNLLRLYSNTGRYRDALDLGTCVVAKHLGTSLAMSQYAPLYHTAVIPSSALRAVGDADNSSPFASVNGAAAAAAVVAAGGSGVATAGQQQAVAAMHARIVEVLGSRMADDGPQVMYLWAAEQVSKHQKQQQQRGDKGGVLLQVPETVFMLQAPGVHLQCVHMIRWLVIVQHNEEQHVDLYCYATRGDKSRMHQQGQKAASGAVNGTHREDAGTHPA